MWYSGPELSVLGWLVPSLWGSSMSWWEDYIENRVISGMYKEGKRKTVVLLWGVIPNDLNTSRQSPPLEGSTTSQSPTGKRGLTTHVPVTHRYPSHSRGSSCLCNTQCPFHGTIFSHLFRLLTMQWFLWGGLACLLIHLIFNRFINVIFSALSSDLYKVFSVFHLGNYRNQR